MDDLLPDDIKEDLRRETGAQVISTGVGDRVSQCIKKWNTSQIRI